MFKLEKFHKICFRHIKLVLFKSIHDEIRGRKVKKISKVLIANRGEIAVRIIRSARKLGIKCIAVYSDEDENALHVKLADQAYNIGPAPSISSYLNYEKIIESALKSSSDAIHPGYGFLSENFEFAKLCRENNLIFIGPPENAIKDMGIKSTSKKIMSLANVPIIPGYHGENQNSQFLFSKAKKIGFPIMIKAIRGGGGKGMRICLNENEFFDQLNLAKSEAFKSFNNDEMLIEKCILKPRHIEVQIFGDMFGNYVYLFERDCSIQRRHQKVIEEAPAPGLSDELRKKLGEAAINSARAVNYVGAGTVEFIFDCNTNEFYFMEMNTRLQVEHPITEMITNTDLVEMQFLVASGERLHLNQDNLQIKGHSFEARIYAEDPLNNFLPGSGKLNNLIEPKLNEHVRLETGVRKGDNVSVFYDPMIAKLVVWSNTREEALDKLKYNLSNYMITGLKTNIPFLIQILDNDEFKKENLHTNFIQDHHKELFSKNHIDEHLLCKFVMGIICNNLQNTQKNFNTPFNLKDSFRLFNLGQTKRKLTLIDESSNEKYLIKVIDKGNNLFDININNLHFENVYAHLDENYEITITLNKIKTKYNFLVEKNNLYVFRCNQQPVTLKMETPNFGLQSESSSSSQDVVSPMPGIVEKIFVEEGENVKKNDPLVVIIAMKMEYLIKAERDGKVNTIKYRPGDNVAKGALLINFET